MIPRIHRQHGALLATLLPWLVAAASVSALVVTQWPSLTTREPNLESPPDGAASPKQRQLELALATARSENEALRRELDRLIDREPASADAAVRSGLGGAAGASQANLADGDSKPDTAALANRVQEGVVRAAAGDAEGAREAATAIFDTLRAGPEAFPALKDAYLETNDPRARMMMIPSLIFSGSADARDFLMEEMQQETDPNLRRVLIQQTSRFATPDAAPAVKDAYLDALRTEDDTATRVAAIRGLRYASGTNVRQALVDVAAGAEDENLRRTAIATLATRPGARETLRDLLASERSPAVREWGQCQLLLAEGS